MNGARKTTLRRFGWFSLSCWAIAGLLLESLHGWKASFFLDDALTHRLLTLSHAHGVGLSLVVLVFGEAGLPCFGARGDSGAGSALVGGTLLVPTAFGLSAWEHPEGDPNVAIWLVPLGALAIVFALLRTTLAAFRNEAG